MYGVRGCQWIILGMFRPRMFGSSFWVFVPSSFEFLRPGGTSREVFLVTWHNRSKHPSRQY